LPTAQNPEKKETARPFSRSEKMKVIKKKIKDVGNPNPRKGERRIEEKWRSANLQNPNQNTGKVYQKGRDDGDTDLSGDDLG